MRSLVWRLVIVIIRQCQVDDFVGPLRASGSRHQGAFSRGTRSWCRDSGCGSEAVRGVGASVCGHVELGDINIIIVQLESVVLRFRLHILNRAVGLPLAVWLNVHLVCGFGRVDQNVSHIPGARQWKSLVNKKVQNLLINSQPVVWRGLATDRAHPLRALLLQLEV